MNRPTLTFSFSSAPLSPAQHVSSCRHHARRAGLHLGLGRGRARPDRGTALWYAVGFPWRWSKPLSLWLHDVLRIGSWVVLAACLGSIRWPMGVLRRIDRVERTQLAFSALAAVLAVSLMKSRSQTRCPWDLQVFGGVAHYVFHWAIGVADGGPGGCFSAGHASAAFAHTLWTAWICWTVAFVIDTLVRLVRRPALRMSTNETA